MNSVQTDERRRDATNACAVRVYCGTEWGTKEDRGRTGLVDALRLWEPTAATSWLPATSCTGAVPDYYSKVRQ